MMDKLRAIQAVLAGKKTYIVAAALALVPLMDFLTGDMTLVALLQDQVFLNGLGFAALRAAVGK